MAPQNIRDQLRRDEGSSRRLYYLKGVPHIGIGHNLRDKPISAGAEDHIFQDDADDAEAAVKRVAPWYEALSLPRRGVLVNLAFWVGEGGLRGFPKMLRAMQEERWRDAASELLDRTPPPSGGEALVVVDEARALRLAEQLVEDHWV